MREGYRPPRPAILGPIAAISLGLSILNVVWVAGVGLMIVLLGLGSWLLGPLAGVVGTAVAGVVLLVLVAQSLLSLLLFVAGWRTWGGVPSGLSYHQTWAWITAGLDLIMLAFTGGLEPGVWVRLIYAGVILYVMNREDVVEYFLRPTSYPPAKEPAYHEWP